MLDNAAFNKHEYEWSVQFNPCQQRPGLNERSFAYAVSYLAKETILDRLTTRKCSWRILFCFSETHDVGLSPFIHAYAPAQDEATTALCTNVALELLLRRHQGLSDFCFLMRPGMSTGMRAETRSLFQTRCLPEKRPNRRRHQHSMMPLCLVPVQW